MSIAKMLGQFADEAAGAVEYSRCARRDQAHGQMYRQMASAEMEHAKLLRQAIEAELDADGDKAGRYDELADGIRSMLADRVREAGAEL